MKRANLRITYRKGTPVAAYYRLPVADGMRSESTKRCAGGLLVDVAGDGTAIGVEITAPLQLDVEILNAVLDEFGCEPALPEDLSPLVAA